MKPDPGKPEVRNFREDAGNVAYGARASVLPDPVGGVHAPTGNPRGPVRAGRVAERPVVPRKPGNAGGGKGPQVWSDAGRMNACGSGLA